MGRPAEAALGRKPGQHRHRARQHGADHCRQRLPGHGLGFAHLEVAVPGENFAEVQPHASVRVVHQLDLPRRHRANVDAQFFGEFAPQRRLHGLADLKLADWDKTLRTNLTGPFLVARQMDRDIVGKWPCTLINVASMYALNGAHHRIYEGMPFKNFSAYGVTKAGIHGLTVWLAGYWASRGATVNTIAPGAVFNNHSEEFQRRVGELIMLDRMAKPDEIADAMLFLASPQAGYMTGQMVNVDGGFSGW